MEIAGSARPYRHICVLEEPRIVPDMGGCLVAAEGRTKCRIWGEAVGSSDWGAFSAVAKNAPGSSDGKLCAREVWGHPRTAD